MIVDANKIKKSVGIIGESIQIEEMCTLIGQVANTDISVLVTGESGTGKEMVAKALHKNSRRKFESIITVNCAAIPSGIIESELFGHRKGSFTGAHENHKGYFEAADKGTIFLDEIGELPLETQAKLLRVIEQGEFMRVGETKTQKTDVRIIAATNRKLNEEVKDKKFRQDLYFRLKTVSIDVTPLREHISDLFLYIERFGLLFTTKNDIPFKGFSKEAVTVMKHYNWPGNIRELKNTIESLLAINKGERIQEDMVIKYLKLDSLENSFNDSLPVPVNKDTDTIERELILKQLLFLRQDVNELKQLFATKLGDGVSNVQSTNSSLFVLPEKNNDSIQNLDDGLFKGIKDDVIGEITMNELEKEVIERTLKNCKGNRRKTAKILDISERTLYRKLKEYEIS
ncbi:sigma-54-dependent Fis family transcriptional regulator [bacterium]|nr:MAG: sigma-54-dependent Fis family transcriptional regulator [bacterium]